MCCSVQQCTAVCCSVLQCAAVCCSVLQCTAVCCSVLQCVAVYFSGLMFLLHCCVMLEACFSGVVKDIQKDRIEKVSETHVMEFLEASPPPLESLEASEFLKHVAYDIQLFGCVELF